MSFVLAILFFAGELLYFKTLSWKSALQPMTVAGGSNSATLSPGTVMFQRRTSPLTGSHMHPLVHPDM